MCAAGTEFLWNTLCLSKNDQRYFNPHLLRAKFLSLSHLFPLHALTFYFRIVQQHPWFTPVMLQLRKSSHVVTLCCLHMLWLCAFFTCDTVLLSHAVTLCCLHMWHCAVFTCCDCIRFPHLWDYVDSSLFPKSLLKILQLMWSLFSFYFLVIWWLWPPVNKLLHWFLNFK